MRARPKPNERRLSGRTQRSELAGVVAEDQALRVGWKGLQLAHVIERARHAFDVRPVRTEDHPVRAHQVDDLVDVVLPEGIDPDVAAERLRRVLREVARHLVVGRPQLLEEITQEVGPVLDGRDAHIREAVEQLVERERDEKVVGGTLDVERLHVRAPAAAREAGGEAVDRVAVAAVATVARMAHDRDSGLVHARPERIERRVAHRALAVPGVRRRGPHHDDARVSIERPFEFACCPVDVGEAQVWRREYPAVVVETPILVEPAIEAREERRHGFDVVLQQLLVEHAEGREQPHALEAELVESGDSSVAVAVLGRSSFAFGEELPRLLAFGVAAEVVVHRARPRNRVEGGIDDGVTHHATDDVVLAPVDLAPLHAPRLHLRVDVPGEGVERFVIVIVGVERQVIEFAHGMMVLSAPVSDLLDVTELIDLDWSLVGAGRAQMHETGACEIPNFIRPSALGKFVEDARGLAPVAHPSGGLGTVYLGFPDESFPTDHPRQWLGPYAVGAVAYDLFPVDSPIRLLFECEELMQFVAAILGLDAIYRYADPLGALNLAVMNDGDELQWHFDQTDFVVSLALQD